MAIPRKDLLTYVRAQPFRPFRIVFNSGRNYDIRHPELIKVGPEVAIIFDPVKREGPFDEMIDWHTVGLDLIEHLEHLKPREKAS